jgi:hypothetical protein
MDDKEIEHNIIAIVNEFGSEPHGMSKTELTRIYTERWGTSKTTIWEYIFELINMGKLELRKTKKQQKTLFIPVQK